MEKLRATEGQALLDSVDVACGLSLGEYTALAFAGVPLYVCDAFMHACVHVCVCEVCHGCCTHVHMLTTWVVAASLDCAARPIYCVIHAVLCNTLCHAPSQIQPTMHAGPHTPLITIAQPCAAVCRRVPPCARRNVI